MDKYHVYSTDDMVHWIDHGEILQASQVPWGRPEGGFMWAPDCAYRNGTYYFYFPHPSGTDWNNTWKIGIATSKYPAKDFKGQWYAFYHNSSLSHNDWLRSVCVDKLYYHADGTIEKVIQTGLGS